MAEIRAKRVQIRAQVWQSHLLRNEVDEKAAVGIAAGDFLEEGLAVRPWNGLKGSGDASGVGIRVSEVVHGRKFAWWLVSHRLTFNYSGHQQQPHQNPPNTHSSHCSLSLSLYQYQSVLNGE